MSDLLPLIQQLGSKRILVVGDVMLDRFVEGTCDRISPEAPVPVLRRRSERLSAGGAGNAAANIVAMGAEAVLASIAGHDDEGDRLGEVIAAHRRILWGPGFSAPDRRTTVKTRYAAGQHLLRVDDETVRPLDETEITALKELVEREMKSVDGVLISDYCKGVLADDTLVEWIVREASAHDLPVIVDSKSPRYEHRFDGVTAITPNLAELRAFTRCPVENEQDIEAAARRMIRTARLQFVAVTRGAGGASLVTADEAWHEPSLAPETVDVSGAGDTFAAALTLAIACGASHHLALRFANMAAGVAVQKLGTAVVTTADLLDGLHGQPMKLAINPQEVEDWTSLWRRQGLKIGFTNGVFDLLHADHVAFLRRCRAQCHRLIVGINADDSVRRLKGEGRPVHTAEHRARILSALSDVDMVVIFDQDTPQLAIEHIRPDVLIKDDGYKIADVAGADFVRNNGGDVMLVPRGKETSTTETVERMKAAQERAASLFGPHACPVKDLEYKTEISEMGEKLKRERPELFLDTPPPAAVPFLPADRDYCWPPELDIYHRAREWLYHQVLPWWQADGVGTQPPRKAERACEQARRTGHKDNIVADFDVCRSMVQARQMAVFSRAGNPHWARGLYWPVARRLAEGFADFMHTEGGVIHSIDPDGEPSRTRTLYDQAFALFAHAHYIGSGAALSPVAAQRRIDLIWRFVLCELTAPEGYWSSLVDSGKGAATLQDTCHIQDDHMHLFEACLALFEATRDIKWTAIANDILSLLFKYCVKDGVLYESFDAEWSRLEDPDRGVYAVKPGHHFEWVWLLLEYRRLFGDPEDEIGWLAANLYQKAMCFTETESRHVPYLVTPDGKVLDGRRRLWPQCEALRAHHAMAKAWPQDSSIAARRDSTLRDILTDHADGPLWHEWLEPDGTPIEGPVPASSLYHLYFCLDAVLRDEKR